MQILLRTSKTIGIWSGIKLYKAINIFRYKNTSFSNLGKKKISPRDQNTWITLANDKEQAQAIYK